MSFKPIGIVSIVLYAVLCHSLAVQSEPTDTMTVNADSQQSLAVTIYNNNLALIKEVRSVTLPADTIHINFMDVAQSIIPSSVYIKSLQTPDAFIVLEQNYEYDLMDQNKLMDKYVGKNVKLIFKSVYDGSEEEREAVLLSNNNGPIYKIDDEIHLGFPGRIILPKLPDDLLARPTLVWMVDNRNASAQDLEVSYLTNGFSWRCDYVMVLNQDDTTCGLSGWVTINNQSGTHYDDAQIKLVAGEVNQVREDTNYMRKAYAEVAMSAVPKPQFAEESFFEYHLYTLQRPATIKQNQMKQIMLMETSEVKLTKKYVVNGYSHYYTSVYRDPIQNVDVKVMVEFMNSDDNNLGMPLPEGIIRVYKADKDGMLQFTGENRIDHTPKNEKIDFSLGNAFDIVAERTQTEWRKVRNDLYEVEWRITIRNHKEKNIDVAVQESIPGDWEIKTATYPYKKISAQTVEFTVPVTADGETTLTYYAEIKY